MSRDLSLVTGGSSETALFSALGANAILLNRLPARVSENKEFLKRICNSKSLSKMLLSKKDSSDRCSRNRYNGIVPVRHDHIRSSREFKEIFSTDYTSSYVF